MAVIELKNLTKDYGAGKGIFDLNLSIEKGEMIGFVGTNGSGKTTTIKSILKILMVIKPNNNSDIKHKTNMLKIPNIVFTKLFLYI